MGLLCMMRITGEMKHRSFASWRSKQGTLYCARNCWIWRRSAKRWHRRSRLGRWADDRARLPPMEAHGAFRIAYGTVIGWLRVVKPRHASCAYADLFVAASGALPRARPVPRSDDCPAGLKGRAAFLQKRQLRGGRRSAEDGVPVREAPEPGDNFQVARGMARGTAVCRS